MSEPATAPPLPARPLCVLLGALGGQGGGVLSDWLATAARLAGYPAQATSIPGVAQRTGATTYYFELYPRPDLELAPVFSLFPSSGDVDLVAALEPTEAGRALERGWVTEGTVVITTARRVFSTSEKSVAGDGTVDVAATLDALRAASLRVLDLDRAAGGHPANAVLLGAIAGTRILPLRHAHFEDAIRVRGVAVEANLAGFAAGRALEQEAPTASVAVAAPALHHLPAPAEFTDTVAALPPPLRPIAGHGLARLADYQGAKYARLYLARVQRVLAVDDEGDSERRLVREVARRLAAWMSFEDIIRVAQLKTRPGRLARIRAELGASSDQPLTVVDYLKPGSRELRALLPAPLAAAIPELGGSALRLHTSSAGGYLVLRLLAALRPLRPLSSGYAVEQALIERWLDAIVEAAGQRRHDLALATARLAAWARGYGDVRQRGHRELERLLGDWSARLASDPEQLGIEVAASLDAARNDPDAHCGSTR